MNGAQLEQVMARCDAASEGTRPPPFTVVVDAMVITDPVRPVIGKGYTMHCAPIYVGQLHGTL
jgi:hypothetical protein